MINERLFFYVSLIYLSLALGVYIKFRLSGVKTNIFLFATFAPILFLIVAPCYAACKMLYETEGSVIRKLREALITVRIAYQYFPVLVGLMAKRMAETCSVKSSKRAINIDFLAIAQPYLYVLYGIRNQRLANLKVSA